jgi:hypothetical protein
MKTKLRILTILLTQHFCLTFGQNFAPIGAEWYYTAMAGGMAPTNSEYYHFKCVKDTTINEHSLKKIEITYYRYRGDSVILTPYYFSQSQDTVSLYNPELNKFYKLFMFNTKIGDTLTLDIPYDNFYIEDTTYRVIIDTVIMETYGDTQLKKYVLNQIDDFGWFCGFYLDIVGGYEWFLPLGKAIIPEENGPIRCYHDNDIEINFVGYDCDKRIINSLSNPIYDEKFIVYPNPTNGLVQIKSELKFNHIEILDYSGKKILESDKNVININDLDKGMYLFKVLTNTMQIIERVIKY